MSEFTVLEVDDLTVLNDAIRNHPVVAVSFGAPSWCVPCRRLKPHFHAASETATHALFIEVDIDKSPEIADAFQIQSVPQVFLYKNGTFFDNVEGRTAVAIINEVG